MKFKNPYLRAGALVAFIAVLVVLNVFARDFFIMCLTAVGGWWLGRTFCEWVYKKFP